MSEFLKNFESALAGKVLIEQPKDEFGKHGSTIVFKDGDRNISSYLKQFCCVPPDIVNDGPAILPGYYDVDKEFTIEHIQKLVPMISDFARKISFVPLILPYGVLKAELTRHGHIVGRYVENYYPMSDQIMKRWDFLVMKLDF